MHQLHQNLENSPLLDRIQYQKENQNFNKLMHPKISQTQIHHAPNVFLKILGNSFENTVRGFTKF